MFEHPSRTLRLRTVLHDVGLWRAIAFGACFMAPVAAAAESVLTSAPVDYSIYRAGEVRRVERQFEAWQLTCDEIRRLGRKFCSLRGVARSSDGTIVAALTVSTDDSGRPAALLRLPFGTVLPSGVILRKPEVPPRRRGTALALRPTVCDEGGCEVVWSLDPDDIRILRTNQAVRIAFKMTKAPLVLGALLAAASPIEGTIQTAGFSAALAASMDR